MAATSSDKALFMTAVLALLGSAGAFGYLLYDRAMTPSLPPPRVELASVPYEPVASEAPPVKAELWNAPAAQSRGREWIYDTFTPPEIFYNARSKQFSVKPPSSLMEEEMEAFGLELVAVRPEPFRLQLIGYVGEEGQHRGVFQNVLTGEVMLKTSGERVPSLGVTIKSFVVQPQAISIPESMTTQQRVATAVLRDEKTGRDVPITHRERLFTGTVFAFVAAAGETATREVRVGDAFKLAEATYRIERISITPPAIEVVKESPTLTQPERRVLAPREAETAEPPQPGGG
jgi:hypothetical protein